MDTCAALRATLHLLFELLYACAALRAALQPPSSPSASSLALSAQSIASQNISPKTAPPSQNLKSIGCSGSTLTGNLLPRISQLT
ncbi:hypothetical protein T484DRAFT_1925395 [Baffinella frigidus]|nr:hypothetical protein T484DRAFT_1925395 [Cryptophyta sp. CCMP2293]